MTEENTENNQNSEENDVVLDTNDLDDSVVSEESAQETIKKLREKIKALEKEKQEYLTGWQRTKADYVNSKKEEELRRKDLIKFAGADILSELIPALDAFDMAMSNTLAWEKVDQNWRKGIEYIYGQIIGALNRHGLTQENPKGESFDINKHHSIEVIKTEEKEKSGKVAEVLQKGYSLHGKEIRPATVKVYE